MIDTAIVVTDSQTAIKANRNANTGFMFYALGAPIKSVKFKLIVFACSLSSHVAKEWSKDVVNNCLDDDGYTIGFIDESRNLKLLPKTKPETKAKTKSRTNSSTNTQTKKLARRKAKKKATK